VSQLVTRFLEKVSLEGLKDLVLCSDLCQTSLNLISIFRKTTFVIKFLLTDFWFTDFFLRFLNPWDGMNFPMDFWLF
jgi:hypothetical protein